jgi:excisionase family DNA binding protein
VIPAPHTITPAEPAPGRFTRLRDRVFGPRPIASATAPLMDAKQAGPILGVPASWLLAQAREGKIPHHRLGHYVRFDLDELNHWLQANKHDPHSGHAHKTVLQTARAIACGEHQP